MTQEIKFKAFSTRLGKFIMEELGGVKTTLFESKISSYSSYYKCFNQNIRISNHLGTKLTANYINIICPMFNTTNIIIFYKHVVYTVHSEKEIKSILKSLCLWQEHFEKSEENIEDFLKQYNDNIIKTLSGVPDNISSEIQKLINKSLNEIISKKLNPLFNNLTNVINNAAAKINKKVNKLDYSNELIESVSEKIEFPDRFTNTWAKNNISGWGNLNKTLQVVILDYCNTYPNRLPNIKELIYNISNRSYEEKLKSWIEFKKKYE